LDGETHVPASTGPNLEVAQAGRVGQPHPDLAGAGDEAQYPDASPEGPWQPKADSRFLANAFFAHSARLLAQTAALLERADDASRYHTVADELAARTWAEWGEHAITTQTGSAVALCFDLVPDGERAAVAATLARRVREVDGRVATGFLGTPLVLPALANAGYWDEAYTMLLRTEPPSWLYQVGRGATTVWERWDAIRPDGSIHPGTMQSVPEIEGSDGESGHMLSFNHYAYGAVIDWVYRHVAGISPDIDAPGYRRVVLAPEPVRGVDWARASVETPYGPVVTSWRLDGDRCWSRWSCRSAPPARSWLPRLHRRSPSTATLRRQRSRSLRGGTPSRSALHGSPPGADTAESATRPKCCPSHPCRDAPGTWCPACLTHRRLHMNRRDHSTCPTRRGITLAGAVALLALLLLKANAMATGEVVLSLA
jgi:hypothetical protein